MKRLIEWIKNILAKAPPVYEDVDVGRTEVTVFLYNTNFVKYWIQGYLEEDGGTNYSWTNVIHSDKLARDIILAEGKSGLIGYGQDKYYNLKEVRNIELHTQPYIIKREIR